MSLIKYGDPQPITGIYKDAVSEEFEEDSRVKLEKLKNHKVEDDSTVNPSEDK